MNDIARANKRHKNESNAKLSDATKTRYVRERSEIKQHNKLIDNDDGVNDID
jgi:hypothetical protein